MHSTNTYADTHTCRRQWWLRCSSNIVDTEKEEANIKANSLIPWGMDQHTFVHHVLRDRGGRNNRRPCYIQMSSDTESSYNTWHRTKQLITSPGRRQVQLTKHNVIYSLHECPCVIRAWLLCQILPAPSPTLPYLPRPLFSPTLPAPPSPLFSHACPATSPALPYLPRPLSSPTLPAPPLPPALPGPPPLQPCPVPSLAMLATPLL